LIEAVTDLLSGTGWLAPGELRLFEPTERDNARAWLSETSSG
jgi:hypothetical protein